MPPLVITRPYKDIPFSPADVPGMLLWYDFSDISSLWQDQLGTIPVTANGQPIGKVDPQSPTSFALTAALGFPTYNSTGQNGLGTVTFNHSGGTQQLRALAIVQSSPFTHFIASTTPFLGARSVVVDQNGCGGNRFVYLISGGQVSVYNGTTLNTTITPNTFRSVTIEADTVTTVWDQTTVDTTGNMGTMGQSVYMLGSECTGNANTAGTIEIGEVIEYSGSLSPTNVTNIQNYLIAKWGA